ncbi:Signal transduction histidine kinase [Stigmatella aurantiaca]|uniref:histidine kinase n=1 Tax=Stigmatella aurantiaca TaxID=41 RepID=A0A1H7K788_STIAU|nr:ATP-binding protein [Stigmatella aurantiaca]SEK81775.1 Signal transduction histidine kinase [Stigmatella aurantiaca]
MASLIESLDWSRSPLGPIETWPQSLRTTVSLCLASNFPINIIWGDGHNQIYNEGYRVVCGAVHPRAMGESYQVTWASAWPAIGEPFERALAGETSYLENQRMFLERNGYPEETFFTFSLSPIRDESGKVVGLFHPVTETTQTMIAQRRTRALRDIADRAGQAQVFDEACDLLLATLGEYGFDLPFALLYVTEPAGTEARLRGTCGTQAGGPLAPEVIRLTPGAREKSWPLRQAMGSGRAEPVPDVEARFGRVSAGPYPEPLGMSFVLPVRVAGVAAPLGFLVIGVSQRLPLDDAYRAFVEMLSAAANAVLGNARAYEAERRRAEALADLDQAKTAFFSNVSHEFRTPLTLMLGPVEELLSGRHGALSEAALGELEVVHRNALRLLKLVNALLDFSRIEAGRAQASVEPTDLSALTRDVASAFRSAVERAGMRFVVDVEPLGEPVLVDREMWEKIVLNLVSNAFKFTHAGEIRVALKREGGVALLSVQDTGIGIPASELGRVFQRFHRVHEAKGRTHEGSGIGLALVQDLAKLHGGSVEVRSTVGEGSTFLVRVPLGNAYWMGAPILDSAQRPPPNPVRIEAFVEETLRWQAEPSPAAPVPVPAQPPGAAVSTGPRPRILLADDNADMRDYVRRLLESRYQVTAVANGAEALQAARAARPDLVLSDVMMPVMDGIELVQQLRADSTLRTLPVILLSARAGEEATASGLELGADDYLTKPFAARELLARVQAQLTMAALRQRAAEQEAHAVALTQHQQWLQAVLDRLPVPTLLVDPDSGRFTFVNHAAQQLADGGFPMDLDAAENGRSFRITGEDEGPLGLTRMLNSQVRDLEALCHSPAGRFHLVADSGFVPGVGSHPAQTLLTFTDITRLKRVEQELKTLLDARDEFLSIASHELKTPITSLRMQLQMTERNVKPEEGRAPSPERLAKALRVSLIQVDRLTSLVDDLLDLARIRTGTLDLDFKEADLAQLASDMLERFAGQLALAGCQVRLEAPPGLLGVWDGRRLEQVLTNLVSNAVRYAPGGLLAVRLSEEGDLVRLEVRDQGPGVPDALRETIFDRFDRGMASRNTGGLGLGLFISKQIVSAHGGTIAVENPPGGGACFVVLLPHDASRFQAQDPATSHGGLA